MKKRTIIHFEDGISEKTALLAVYRAKESLSTASAAGVQVVVVPAEFILPSKEVMPYSNKLTVARFTIKGQKSARWQVQKFQEGGAK